MFRVLPARAEIETSVAALYVEADGCYAGLQGVDAWPAERDARLYDGPWPVIGHPPCQRWSVLAPSIEAQFGHRVGDDGGCFEAALYAVETYGGVLEHPAESLAWREFRLPMPTRGGWACSMFSRGWSTEISQVAYGHAARKRTWLYYVGDRPPPAMDWSEPLATRACGHDRSFGLPRVRDREALATPPALRDALLSLARGAR